jgi:hypothetical protein
MKKIIKFRAIFYLIIIFCLIDSYFYEPKNFRLKKVIVKIQNLPKELNNLRICQISDLHIRDNLRSPNLKNLSSSINKIQPDLIFITGDFLHNGKIAEREIIKFLKSLKSRYGKFGVFGNWDYWDLNVKQREMINNEIKILADDNQKIKIKKEKIWILGVNDPSYHSANLQKAMKNVPKNSFKILLSHSPDILEQTSGKKIDLIFAGHTHGGQIRLPIIGAIIILSRVDKKYDSGLFKINDNYIYINQGIGTTVLPLRFLCMPEITLVILKPL